jgi:hypothetical protein
MTVAAVEVGAIRAMGALGLSAISTTRTRASGGLSGPPPQPWRHLPDGPLMARAVGPSRAMAAGPAKARGGAGPTRAILTTGPTNTYPDSPRSEP